jgi:hypothetical protein
MGACAWKVIGVSLCCKLSRFTELAILMPRTRLQQLPTVNGAELNILSKKDWGSLIFIPVWLAFWTFGGIMAMKWLIHPGPSTPRAFITFWLAGWLFGEVWATYWWFWTAFGKEIVTIREGTLNIKRDILGYGRTRSFAIGSVSNLRASGFFPSDSYWENYLVQFKLAGGTVGFDFQGKIKKFGIQLTEPEAQEVVRDLKPYLPS